MLQWSLSLYWYHFAFKQKVLTPWLKVRSNRKIKDIPAFISWGVFLSRHSRYSILKMTLICHMFWHLISSACNSVRGTGLSCIKLLVGTPVSCTFYLLLFFELLSEIINQIINGDSHCGEICETWFQWIFSSLRVVFKCQELVYYLICLINLLHIFLDWYPLQWVRLHEIFPQKKVNEMEQNWHFSVVSSKIHNNLAIKTENHRTTALTIVRTGVGEGIGWK